MTAIQRWYWLPDMAIGDHDLGPVPPGIQVPPDDELWCKATDVAQLELLLRRYLEDLSTSRQSRDRAKADLSIADAKIASLEAELLVTAPLREQVDNLLAHCRDPECGMCSIIICPHKDSSHFHHDGCPSCAELG